MTLDKLVSQIAIEKDGKMEINSKYNPRSLLALTENILKLEKCDMESEEGLKIYHEITGDNPAKYSPEEIRFRQRGHIENGKTIQSIYANKHIESITDELDESSQMNLAFSYCLKNDTKDKKYNEVRKIVTKALETLTAIKQDPKKYIAEKIKESSPLMAGYIVRYQEEFLQIKMRKSEKDGYLAIAHYGVKNFLKTTGQQLEAQNKELSEAEKTIREKIQTKKDSAEKEQGKSLSQVEIVKLISGERESLKNIYEKYSDAGSLEQFRKEIIGMAIQTIAQKEEKAKKEAQAKQSE